MFERYSDKSLRMGCLKRRNFGEKIFWRMSPFTNFNIYNFAEFILANREQIKI